MDDQSSGAEVNLADTELWQIPGVQLPPLAIDPIMHSPTTQSTSPSSASSGDSAEHNSLPTILFLDVPIAVRKPIRQHFSFLLSS